jgi:hypothetical protein
MPTPKFGRRKVRIDPRLPLPPGVVDVEIDESKSSNDIVQNSVGNGYTGGISRDDSNVGSGGTRPTDESPVQSGTNPWGVATIEKQELVINSDGVVVVEVTFKLPDWGQGYNSQVSRA